MSGDLSMILGHGWGVHVMECQHPHALTLRAFLATGQLPKVMGYPSGRYGKFNSKKVSDWKTTVELMTMQDAIGERDHIGTHWTFNCSYHAAREYFFVGAVQSHVDLLRPALMSLAKDLSGSPFYAYRFCRPMEQVAMLYPGGSFTYGKNRLLLDRDEIWGYVEHVKSNGYLERLRNVYDEMVFSTRLLEWNTKFEAAVLMLKDYCQTSSDGAMVLCSIPRNAIAKLRAQMAQAQLVATGFPTCNELFASRFE